MTTRVLMIMSDPCSNGKDVWVRYLMTDEPHTYYEDRVYYDSYEDAIADIKQFKTWCSLEFHDDTEDDYMDDVTEEQEWFDYDPDC